MINRFIPLLMAVATLAGCVGGGIRSGAGDAQERWQLSGKIGLRAPQMAESAYVNWRQCGPHFAVRISGPLGQTVARIEGREDSMILHFEGRPALTTSEPEQLMQEQLGWSLPLRALRYWVRAQAAPEGEPQFDGPAQQPNSLLQQQWRIDYLGYHQDGAAPLPSKLRLTRNNSGADNASDVDGSAHLQATLLINEWALGDAADCPR